MAKLNMSRQATRSRLIQRTVAKIHSLARQGKSGTKEFSKQVQLLNRLESGMFYK